MRSAPLLLLLVLTHSVSSLGCRSRATPSAARADAAAAALAPVTLPGGPVDLDLSRPPVVNPLNVFDMQLDGAPAAEVVGTLDGEPVTTRELDAPSGEAFTHLGERLYEARERGWRWLLDHTGLEHGARAAGLALAPYLRRAYATLPAPTDADLDAEAARANLRELPAAERRAAALTLWRLRQWDILRSVLVRDGLAGVRYERYQLMIADPTYAAPTTAVATIDGREITRAELRELAGFQAELIRHEYWRAAKEQFERHVSELLLTREAQRRGVTTAELDAQALRAAPAITEAEVQAFIRDAPEYAADPQGHERARDQVRRLHEIAAREGLATQLRAAAKVEFLLREPEIMRVAVEPPAPRTNPQASSAPGAPLVALFGLGCDSCGRGAAVVLEILAQYEGRVHLVAADYFGRKRLGSYRGALALWCADEQGDLPKNLRLLGALAMDFGQGTIADLAMKAGALGFDAAAFTTCLRDDRYLPLIIENVIFAERLGLERNVPGIFIAGTRLTDLGHPDRLQDQIDRAIAQ